jgi:hypothetical protein
MNPAPAIFTKLGRLLAGSIQSRLAWLLVFIHAAWFLLAIANMSPPSPGLANYIEHGGGSSASILAGRPFHYEYESLFSKLLLLSDLPSALASIPVALFLLPLFKLFQVGLYEGSYIGAGILLAMGSLQWLIAGKFANGWLRSRSWGASILQRINRHFVLLTTLILLFTAVSAPLLNARSRRLGFRHAAISYH